MANLVDPHAHLIYGVDDGVTDRAEMLEVAKQYVQVGYTAVICTPHYYPGVFDVTREEHVTLLRSMQHDLDREGIALKLYLGNEFYLHEKIVQEIKAKRGSTLNDSRYALIEFPMSDYHLDTERVLDSLRNEDFIPVMAHPERYEYFQREPQKLLRYIKQGCLIQLNAGSLIGQFGKDIQKLATNLLASDMVHLIGTDAHSKGSRSPLIMQQVFQTIDHPGLEQICYHNPLKILHNIEIERQYTPSYQEITKKKRFKLFK